jgi:hypothetical protein
LGFTGTTFCSSTVWRANVVPSGSYTRSTICLVAGW